MCVFYDPRLARLAENQSNANLCKMKLLRFELFILTMFSIAPSFYLLLPIFSSDPLLAPPSLSRSRSLLSLILSRVKAVATTIRPFQRPYYIY